MRDNVERRGTNMEPPDGQEKRQALSHGEHHSICVESIHTMKEFMCLKLKPVSTAIDGFEKSIGRLWGVAVLIMILLLGSGGVSAIVANGNQRQDSEIETNKEHISDARTEMKEQHKEVMDKLDIVLKAVTNMKIEVRTHKHD